MIRFVKKTKAQHLLELHDLAGPAAARTLSRMSIPESWDQDHASRRVSSVPINYNRLLISMWIGAELRKAGPHFTLARGAENRSLP